MQKGFAPVIVLVGILVITAVAGGVYYFVKIKTPAQKACTQEAKICPDGSSVVRVGPNCEFAACPNSKSSPDFEAVTIRELITNITKFDRKKVLVKGGYKKMPMLQPACLATGSGKPQIKEEYKVYSSTWAITDGVDTLGVEVIDQNSSSNSTLPNYKKDEEIELRGIARATTVPDSCRTDIRFKSIYLEIKAEDINITTKPLPKSPPIDLK